MERLTIQTYNDGKKSWAKMTCKVILNVSNFRFHAFRFRTDLKEVGDIINERNTKRVRKYPYLHPKEVPNAISI